MKIIYGDILECNTEVIVNAANSIGYMGGFISRFLLNFSGFALTRTSFCQGIAEEINYKTKGKVEKEAKKKSKINFIHHYKKGNVFVTNSYLNNCNYIFHAITMKYPGTKSNLKTISCCCDNLIDKCKEYNIKSIAIPLLGCGVGRLKESDVLNIFENKFKEIKDIDIYIIKKNPN